MMTSKSEIVKNAPTDEFECNLDLGDKWTESGFSGITLGYAVNVHYEGIVTFCEYTVTPFTAIKPNEIPRETRAFREMRRSKGLKVQNIAKNALRDEMLILPGAAMSPADVVKALKEFIKHVERDGMYIGKSKDDMFVKEKVAGKPRFVFED